MLSNISVNEVFMLNFEKMSSVSDFVYQSMTSPCHCHLIFLSQVHHHHHHHHFHYASLHLCSTPDSKLTFSIIPSHHSLFHLFSPIFMTSSGLNCSLQDPHRGAAPGPCWGTSVFQTPSLPTLEKSYGRPWRCLDVHVQYNYIFPQKCMITRNDIPLRASLTGRFTTLDPTPSASVVGGRHCTIVNR